MYQTSDIRKGLKIEIDRQPWSIVDFQFVKPGKGCAFTRTKLKNLLTGNVLDRTYKTGESLKPADVEEFAMQFLYSDDEYFHFMNLEDYNQVGIEPKVLGDTKNWLVEEMTVDVMFFEGNPVSIALPNFVEMEITECEPGVKGNTATGATKLATLSSGAAVGVPLFVEQGQWIKIDTRTGQYVERVKR